MKLINQDTAIANINKAIPEWSEDKEIAIDCLKNTPSAQPERCEDCENFSKTRLLIPQFEIIRCKDCIEWDSDSEWCNRHGGTMQENDFCSRAEGRTK